MKKIFMLMGVALLSGLSVFAINEQFGAVNYEKCAVESLYAKQQKTQMENIGKRLESMLSNTETELNATNEKLDDVNFTDALTPQALQELQEKKEKLTEELTRHRQQFMQTARQLQMNASRILHGAISKASKKIAEERSLKYVVSSDAMFFCDDKADITKEVITVMDKSFEEEKALNEKQVQEDIKQLEKEQMSNNIKKASKK